MCTRNIIFACTPQKVLGCPPQGVFQLKEMMGLVLTEASNLLAMASNLVRRKTEVGFKVWKGLLNQAR